MKALLWFVLISILWVLIYRFVPVPYTPLMAIRKYTSEKEITINHQWKNIEEISKDLQLAVICSEDQNFLNHDGFDMKEIEKAYQENKTGKRLRGASTISQQTAKNVFLWPQRSWLRKGLETWFTFLIEVFWSKERILEVYLNSIEMGEGEFGAEAAASKWFNSTAKELTYDQATALAAILPNPRKYKPIPPSIFISKRKNWIKKQMRNYGDFNLIDKNEE